MIEPALVAVSAVLAAFVVIFMFLIFNKKTKKGNSAKIKPAMAKDAPVTLNISGPILPPEAPRPFPTPTPLLTNTIYRPASTISSRASSRWPVTQPRRAFELADNTAPRPAAVYGVQRLPPNQQYETRQQQPLLQHQANLDEIPREQNQNTAQSLVELELHHPAPTYQPLRGNSRNDFVHRPHYVPSDFVDDSTILGDKDDTTTLQSEHFEVDSDDSGSIKSFVLLPESEVGLHKDHWKAGGR
jgi:hypothetical protein